MISNPTTKKKIGMSAVFTQPARLISSANGPTRTATMWRVRPSYEAAHGELAQTMATNAAAASSAPEPVSVLRKASVDRVDMRPG